MENSMDCVLVRFGLPVLSEEEQRKVAFAERILQDAVKSSLSRNMVKAFYTAKDIREFRKLVAQKKKAKELPLKDFLALDPKDLTPEEKMIQSALSFLYEQNAQTPPIYKSFPKRDKPLVIDCTVGVDKYAGIYMTDLNEIHLKGKGKKLSRVLEILAHELKHAEQHIGIDGLELNNYQKQQLHFLDEALAYACDKFVLDRYYKEFPEERREKSILERLFGSPELDEFEGDMSPKWVADHVMNFMYSDVSSNYKNRYDEDLPILYTDKGLTSIPDAFGVDKKDMVSVIKALDSFVSKKATTPLGILIQAVANEDSKKITRICNAKNSQKEYAIDQEELRVFIESSCVNNASAFKAIMESNRFEKDDFADFMTSVLHVSDEEVLTESLKENRLKNFEFLITKTDDKGKPLFSNKKLKKIFSLIEETAFNEGEIALQKEAEKILNKVITKPIKKMGKDPRE
ncbi:MAG: hypothetical protein J6V53_05840 [Alphaproteobacteria bacterium]|nr:hypothetical protein [Alphaproteobacteria bacterium]